MKRIIFLALVLFVLGITRSSAQHVRVRLGFPAGVYMFAPGPAPYYGGVWIGPEWEWRNGRYECIPGYWARPRYHGAYWVPGHWRYSHYGYRWVPGYWR